ncbi:DUF559 domain-containing protein [Zobellia nedashkovskayae]
MNEELDRLGYKVFRFWETEVKKELDRCLDEVTQYLESYQ